MHYSTILLGISTKSNILFREPTSLWVQYGLVSSISGHQLMVTKPTVAAGHGEERSFNLYV